MNSESAVWTTAGLTLSAGWSRSLHPITQSFLLRYIGNTVRVADQAGKARKSVTDGFGRLIQVYEDPSGQNYLTKLLITMPWMI